MDRWLEDFAQANFRRSADTAHDLKTPLNVAVLNLELLRMRLAKIAEAGKDKKIAGYAAAIEGELRRMAKIFDAFFLLSTPPKAEGEPTGVDLIPICRDLGFTAPISSPAVVRAHESRIREALKLFREGASKIFRTKPHKESAESAGDWLHIVMSGQPQSADFDIAKIFKFYYTDPQGNADLSLATARLIAETYGGQLDATQEHDKVTLRFSLPLGDR